eukprot:CAMPEP_0119199250 /NCGR_PEP_ID=MMETSP1316-20130426/22095_1 /TAXON_ID=41880 /ORGANISM="Pycnococcus provasolii, Strain RCC2336" /LENGTH=35 /DNA_ID= /DNA_START= /DNA_END= /DNA_ORIENTATION=
MPCAEDRWKPPRLAAVCEQEDGIVRLDECAEAAVR